MTKTIDRKGWLTLIGLIALTVIIGVGGAVGVTLLIVDNFTLS